MLNTINAVNFKAYNVKFDNQRNTIPQMPAELTMPEDVFISQTMTDDRIAKKEKSQERLQKLGIYSSVGIAAALLGSLIFSIMSKRQNAKQYEDMLKEINKEMSNGAQKNTNKIFNVEFEKLTDNKNIADIRTTKTLSKSVQKFFVDLLDSSKFDPKYMKRAGLGEKGFPNASLLLGGPGTGKTETVRMYAKAADSELATIKLGDFANSFVDGTATNMLNMFKAIKEKAEKEPDKTITILFDEVDGLARKIDKIGSNNEYLGKNRQSFITGLDMILPLKNVRVFATSNVPYKEIDEAVISRLKRNVTFKTPNPTQTFEALKFHLKDCEGLKSGSFDFFKNQKNEIEKFLKELYKRNGAYRDLANITQDAQAKYATAMEKAKDDTMLFDVKYLREALAEKGIMAGEGEQINEQIIIPAQKSGFWQKFKNLFNRNN